MWVHVFSYEPYDANDCLYACVLFFRGARMRGARRSVESTGVPSEREGMDTFPPALPRAQSWGVSRWGTSRDPGRSFDVSREGMAPRRMSASMREVEFDVQRRDISL